MKWRKTRMSYLTCDVQHLCRSNDEGSSALTGRGVKVRFADGQAMVAGTEKGLQIIMEKTNRVVKSYRMEINSQKP